LKSCGGSARIEIPANIDFAGRIWAENNTQHIPDIFSEPNGTFMRAQICQKSGLKAAFGFPLFKKIRFGQFWFFSRAIRRNRTAGASVWLRPPWDYCPACLKANPWKALLKKLRTAEKKIRERTKELLKTNESLEVRILEHQRTEEALRGSQKNFSTLLNSIDASFGNWI